MRCGALSAWVLGTVDVLLVSAEAAVQKTVPPAVLASRMIDLKVGEDISLDELKHKFVAAGYKRADEVEGHGQFSVRGGIVDFFPPERELPLRMELWGDTIDTIAEFEVESQRRTDLVDEVLLTPSAEIIAGDGEEDSDEAVAEQIRSIAKKVRSKNADLAKAKLQEDADAIRSGRDLCPDKYINLYYENACTPLGYLREGDLLIAAESGTVKERVNGAVKLYREDLKAALETGEYVKALGDLMIPYQDLVSDYEHADLIYRRGGHRKGRQAAGERPRGRRLQGDLLLSYPERIPEGHHLCPGRQLQRRRIVPGVEVPHHLAGQQGRDEPPETHPQPQRRERVPAGNTSATATPRTRSTVSTNSIRATTSSTRCTASASSTASRR